MSQPLRIPASKPRNPLVPAARTRKAGKHEKGRGAQRQQAKRAMDREAQDVSACAQLA